MFETTLPRGAFEVALLMRRTGAILAAWAKEDVPREVVSVMAATMMGSIETMSEAIGCPSPERVSVETERCRLYAEKFEPQGVLVLVASKDLSPEALERAARQILDRLSGAPGSAPKGRSTVEPRP